MSLCQPGTLSENQVLAYLWQGLNVRGEFWPEKRAMFSRLCLGYLAGLYRALLDKRLLLKLRDSSP